MRYLITGGAGFIGSHLCEALLKKGDEVTVLDNFSTSSPENLAHLKDYKTLTVVELDVVKSGPQVEEYIKASDRVIHLAAAVGVELVVNDPVRTITTNVEGTQNVLLPCAKYNKRVIIASTSEVYGKSTNDKFSEHDDLLIGSPFNSRWSYACSKLLDEFYLMAYHRSSNLPGTVVRFFNTVGPRQTGRYGMVVPRFVEKALLGKPLQVYGDGGQSRCFCHVHDVVKALLLLLDNEESYGRIFNIGSQNLITIKELADAVIAQTKSTSQIEYVPYEKAYAAGFEDMRRRCPDVQEINNLCQWRAQLTLKDIINDVACDLKAKLNIK